MTRHAEWYGSREPATAARFAVLLLLFAWVAPLRADVLITGEVRAESAQGVYVPPTDVEPVVLRFYLPDGSQVQAGDVVLRIDPGTSASQIRSLGLQIEQARARAAKEGAELAVKAIDAERALVDAEAALAKAKVDAAIPRAHLSALDFDRYRGELERATREAALKRDEFLAAQQAAQRRHADGALEVRKLEADLAYHQAQVANAEVRAERPGTLIHGFDNWRGLRYDEGSNTWPGVKVGEIVGAGGMRVRAYALEPDRTGLREGQPVQLSFDALPEARVQGTVARIAGAPEPKAEWGEGRYFSIDIDLPEANDLALKPGMSVRVQAVGVTAAAGAAR